MNELNRHLKAFISANDKFRETFSGYWLGKVNAEVDWLRAYVKHVEDEENDNKQLRLKL